MAVHVNDGVFHLQNAHCSLEVSAGLFILCSPGDREGKGADSSPLSQKRLLLAALFYFTPCLLELSSGRVAVLNG